MGIVNDFFQKVDVQLNPDVLVDKTVMNRKGNNGTESKLRVLGEHRHRQSLLLNKWSKKNLKVFHLFYTLEIYINTCVVYCHDLRIVVYHLHISSHQLSELTT